jgi:hypothetical protein
MKDLKKPRVYIPQRGWHFIPSLRLLTVKIRTGLGVFEEKAIFFGFLVFFLLIFSYWYVRIIQRKKC